MLHGFVFFEREERGFLKHPDFNSIREEDPDLGKEENLLRFEQIYLKRSNVTATGADLEKHPIHAFFEDIRQGLKRRAMQLKQAEPAYIRNLQDFAQGGLSSAVDGRGNQTTAGVLPFRRQARGIRHRAGGAGQHHPHPGFAAFLLPRGIAAGGKDHPTGRRSGAGIATELFPLVFHARQGIARPGGQGRTEERKHAACPSSPHAERSQGQRVCSGVFRPVAAIRRFPQERVRQSAGVPRIRRCLETGHVRGADALCHRTDSERPFRARTVAQRCDLRQQAARQPLWAAVSRRRRTIGRKPPACFSKGAAASPAWRSS